MFFHDEFFPTPPKLINRLLHGLHLSYRETILEPSAGKGDIIKTIKAHLERESYSRQNFDIDAIEIDPNLRHILKGEDIRVVHDDFLTYDTLKRYDVIAMNPPFSNGQTHLLKALTLLKPGGRCGCILNAETLRNPYTNERKELVRKLQEFDAKIEYVTNAFSTAERTTDVEVALIQVTLPTSPDIPSIILDGLKKEEEQKFTAKIQNHEIVDSNPIVAAVARCRLEQTAGIRLIQEYEALTPYILNTLKENEHAKPLIEIKIKPNEYVREVRGKYWQALFENPAFTKQLTSNLRDDLYSRVQDLKNYEFSEYNILVLRLELSKHVISGVEKTIIKLFDELSAQHAWFDESSKNIHYFNGWKTNKSWFINQKVIIPFRSLRTDTWDNNVKFFWDTISKLSDIETALAYLDGGGDTDTANRLHTAEQLGQTRNIDLKYLTVTFFKKGTCHIVFKDLDILRRLNIFGCQHKAWLPPGYGKQTYQEFTQDEKEVIDSFEGETAYAEVLSRNDLLINLGDFLPRLTVDSP